MKGRVNQLFFNICKTIRYISISIILLNYQKELITIFSYNVIISIISRNIKMDKERIYIKLDEIDQYLKEMEEIMPSSSEEYSTDLMRKRALERLIQITIEAVMDVSAILIKEMRLGLPYEEEDFLDKINGTVLDPDLVVKLREMKSFRNILVHGYSQINDERVYEILTSDMKDVVEFKERVIEFLRGQKDD